MLTGAPALAAARVRGLGLAWRAFWVSRALVWAGGLGALALWGESARAPAFDPGGLTTPFGPVLDALVAPAARWDATWFLSVAGGGYDAGPRAAFFPLYPLLARVAGVPLGSTLLGAMALSGACFLGALVVLHRLTELELGPEAARWTVLALALSPMALFFSAVYSESLFLLVTAGAVLAARRERWAWAGTLGACAAATRSTGVLLVVALAWLAWTQRSGWRAFAWTAAVPLGLAAFVGGLALGGVDARAPFHAQDVWLRAFAGPLGGVGDGAVAAWDGARQLLSGSRSPVFFTAAGGDPLAVARQNLALFAWVPLVAAALVGAARRLHPAYAAYALASLAVPLSYPVGPQPLMSLPRFVLVAFGLWMWLGWLLARHPRARVPVLALSAVGLVACSAQFTTWHFVA